MKNQPTKNDNSQIYQLEWPELKKKCTCGARITYGQDTILHSYWCDAYEDKYEKKTCQDDTE